ncbi:MAG: G8 domain-containing protein, partial [Pseudohongiellaceae bacterium]
MLRQALLFAACVSVNVVAQEATSSGKWSDASTWAGGAVPAAGAQVSIPGGLEVVLDTSTPALGGLTINGKLSFSDAADLELVTEWIMVHGELEIGTEARP